MDLALPATPEVDAAFVALGFEKEGRHRLHAALDLLFEAPAPAGLPGEDAPRTVVEVDGLRLVIIGIEDLLIDRLLRLGPWEQRRGRPLHPAARAPVPGPDRLALRPGTHEQGPRGGRGRGQSRTGGATGLIGYDEFQRDARRRKRKR